MHLQILDKISDLVQRPLKVMLRLMLLMEILFPVNLNLNHMEIN